MLMMTKVLNFIVFCLVRFYEHSITSDATFFQLRSRLVKKWMKHSFWP